MEPVVIGLLIIIGLLIVVLLAAAVAVRDHHHHTHSWSKWGPVELKSRYQDFSSVYDRLYQTRVCKSCGLVKGRGI